eukprot:6147612-Prymnesium_polylepis.1
MQAAAGRRRQRGRTGSRQRVRGDADSSFRVPTLPGPHSVCTTRSRDAKDPCGSQTRSFDKRSETRSADRFRSCSRASR